MGVPKFFRWMSERYPAISQLIAENRIPEFDNLYLDMNGIIHNCTHKDSDDATFRLTEEEMFIRIFNYIEHLFGKIKPKKLFFMAIDGVAPRAKMNQQRARRFRTALDAEKARDKAIAEGVEMPKEAPFDSNCITPGTEFMAKLTRHLKYFINKKVTQDSDWQGCEIVLSGHEVPGEGEHKIMEYIRNAKAQPDYDHNVRHCLYGLDADLIMLGLLTHDPHFCLLREEVTFGRASKSASKELEHQNFYLMHLCIVREYLELEFQELKADGVTKFPFDMERVIDDFILMAFFVGNDFLPNLPHLHINEGALATMFRLYKEVLPQCEGYINEGGVINLKSLGLLLNELSKEENRHFEHENSDQKWLRSKQLAEAKGEEMPKSKGKVIMTSAQKELWKTVKKYVQKPRADPLDLGTELVAADRQFIQDLAGDMRLEWRTVDDDEGKRHLVVSLPGKANGNADDEDDDEVEAGFALNRVMKKYDSAQVIDVSATESQASMAIKYKEKFGEWKNEYYSSKFKEWSPDSKETELRLLCENYVQGLQWVLYYYYRGVASWPWFYAYHYSPMISDVCKGFNADVDFQLGQPFRPYEQLMGVLPDRSKSIVPAVYHPLMTDPKSPIIDFYPRDFELDMNGKKMEWEAVVKIPFIDEKRLLSAMATKNDLLSADEKARNDFGVSLKFTYDPTTPAVTYPSSMVGVFPDIPGCQCVENIYDLPTADGAKLYRGLLDNAKLNIEALAGFPSLATLPYSASLDYHGVNVFQQDSRNQSMVVTLSDVEMRSSIETAKLKLGQRCHVGYPFLQEAKIVSVQDRDYEYSLGADNQPVQRHLDGSEMQTWQKKAAHAGNFYSKRLGIVIGPIEVMVQVDMLKGLVKTKEGALIKEYGDIPGTQKDHAAQVIVDEVVSEDQRFIEREALPIEEEFPLGSNAFFLGQTVQDFLYYGRPARVLGHADGLVETVMVFHKPKNNQPQQKAKGQDFVPHEAKYASRFSTVAKPIVVHGDSLGNYETAVNVARNIGVSPLVLSKIASSLFVYTIGNMKVNLGLNLKFEGRKLKVLGYTRKSARGWEYSQAAQVLIAQYASKFPDLFAGMMQNSQGNELRETDLFRGMTPEDATLKVKEIGAWLKTVETSKFEKVPLDAEQLDSNVVKAIEKAVGDLIEEFDGGMGDDLFIKRKAPRDVLLRIEDAEQRLGDQQFSLGDRIIYAAGSGKVKTGAQGTVVGISTVGNHHMLDVVFDQPFMSGTSLGERCSPFRGATVAAKTVLNTTSKYFLAIPKQGNTGGHRIADSIQKTRGNSGGFRGRNGGTYRDAPAPAPLNGSFRGATYGSRGRGAGNAVPQLQHSSLVYRPAPTGAHPQQQHPSHQGGYQANNNNDWQSASHSGQAHHGGQAYNYGQGQPSGQSNGALYGAVPPPPNLNAKDSSRGRGRGRGGRGRGEGRGQRGGRGGASRGRGGPQQNST
ncbi:5'-3' exoribonuclease 1 [Apiospora saccharicola]|uniref:5'-3' exoribonuclease 1 n=1 Tax=Apiospora saccharicola TaxID=335842 RepID=A0ABR1TKA1_9PEZI